MEVVVKGKPAKLALKKVITSAGADKRKLSPQPTIEPYWHHLVRVYQFLVDHNENDSNILLAALLHDSAEDDHLKLAEIETLFGAKVREIVDLLTEETLSDHTIITKRDKYFERIRDYKEPSVRLAAMKIKVADRYDNLQGLSFTNYEDKKTQYLEEIESYILNFAKHVGYEQELIRAVGMLKGTIAIGDLTVNLRYEN